MKQDAARMYRVERIVIYFFAGSRLLNIFNMRSVMR